MRRADLHVGRASLDLFSQSLGAVTEAERSLETVCPLKVLRKRSGIKHLLFVSLGAAKLYPGEVQGSNVRRYASIQTLKAVLVQLKTALLALDLVRAVHRSQVLVLQQL